MVQAESQFLSRAQEGASIGCEDFETFVRLYRPTIFRFALALLRDRDAADSVTQDCFVRVSRNASGFRGESSINTWLFRIVINLIRDRGRNRRLRFWNRVRSTSLPLEDLKNWLASEGRTPEAEAALQQQVALVWQSAENLPDRQRTVFFLRFVEDMDLLQIASVTGMKEGTVKTHLFRALQSVRAQVGGCL